MARFISRYSLPHSASFLVRAQIPMRNHATVATPGTVSITWSAEGPIENGRRRAGASRALAYLRRMRPADFMLCTSVEQALDAVQAGCRRPRGPQHVRQRHQERLSCPVLGVYLQALPHMRPHMRLALHTQHTRLHCTAVCQAVLGDVTSTEDGVGTQIPEQLLRSQQAQRGGSILARHRRSAPSPVN